MSYVLAIEPDHAQALVLQRALREIIREKIVVVSSKDAALSAIDRQVPDLVLLHALMTPGDDDHLVAYLHTLPDTRHVQVLRIPRLMLPARHDVTRMFDRLKRRRDRAFVPACDPRLFAQDAADYLARAHAFRQEIERQDGDGPAKASDRRRAYRWALPDVPWVSAVQLAAGERADLIDISLGGALVRTPQRPHLLSIRGGGHDAWTRPGLMLHLASGEQVQVTGEIVRCRPGSSGQGMFYQVAFRFDESAEMFLPTMLLPHADDHWTRAMAAAKVIGGPTLYLPEVLNQWCQW